MRVQAGQLRHRLTFQKLRTQASGAPLVDAHGGVRREYDDHVTVWGMVEPLDGREYWDAQQANSEAQGRVRIRHRDDIDPTMRIKHKNRYLHILSIIHPLERGDRTTIIYKEALD